MDRSNRQVLLGICLFLTFFLSPTTAYTEGILFVAGNGQIVRSDFDGEDLCVIATNVGSALGVDDVNQNVYFRSPGYGTEVFCSDFDGTEQETFLIGCRPSAFDLDAANNRAFFSTIGSHYAYATDLDNRGLERVTGGLNSIIDLHYDPQTDSIFCANATSLSAGDSIYSFSLDSQLGTRLVSSLYDLGGLALDSVNRKLYFSERISRNITSRVIYSADIDGSNIELLVDTTQFGNSHPADIEVVPELNLMFWTDEWLKGVYRANLDGSNPIKLFDLPEGPDTERVVDIHCPVQIEVFTTVPEPSFLMCILTGTIFLFIRSLAKKK